jgi:hypothetical protein
MHAYGRTLRQSGDLRLLALPVGKGAERYCVLDGPTPLATFTTLARAEACFAAACATGAAGESLSRPAAGAHAAVTRLSEYRRRRAGRVRRRSLGDGAAAPE